MPEPGPGPGPAIEPLQPSKQRVAHEDLGPLSELTTKLTDFQVIEVMKQTLIDQENAKQDREPDPVLVKFRESALDPDSTWSEQDIKNALKIFYNHPALQDENGDKIESISPDGEFANYLASRHDSDPIIIKTTLNSTFNLLCLASTADNSKKTAFFNSFPPKGNELLCLAGSESRFQDYQRMFKAQSGLQQHLISANSSAATQALDLTTPFSKQTVHTTRYLEHVNSIKTAQQCRDIDEHAFTTIINIPANIIAQISEEFPEKFRQYLKKSLSKDELKAEIISQIESAFGAKLLKPLSEEKFWNPNINTAIEQLKLTKTAYDYFDENEEDGTYQINIDKILEELFEPKYNKLCEDFTAIIKINPDQPTQTPNETPLVTRIYSQNIVKEIEEKLSSGKIDQVTSAINILHILSIESNTAAPLHFIKIMESPFQEEDGQISIFQKLTKLTRDPSLKLPAPYIDKIINPETGIIAKYFKYKPQLKQYKEELSKPDLPSHQKLPIILSESTEAALENIDILNATGELQQALSKPPPRADYSSPYIGVARFDRGISLDKGIYYDDIVLSFIARSDGPKMLEKILSCEEKPPQEFLDELLLKFHQHGYHKNKAYHGVIKKVIELGANTNQNINGVTLLQIAIYGNQIDIVKDLISHNADVNAKNSSGQSAIYYAANLANHEIMEALIQKVDDINVKTAGGFTAAMICAQKGNSKTIEVLSQNGADLNIATTNGLSAIRLAITHKQPETIKTLITLRVDQNQHDSDKSNLLHLSAKCNCAESINALIESGIDESFKEKLSTKGLAPIHIAAIHNSAQALKALKQNGCNISLKTSQGENALTIAIEYGNIETVEKLIELGVNVNQKFEGNKTALHVAAKFGQVEIAQLLIKEGADINAKTTKGNTPLHVAAMYNKIEVAQALIIAKADIDSENNKKSTPLYLALKKDPSKGKFPHYNVADLLLESGAEKLTGIPIANHRQLLISAVKHNHIKAVRKLAPLFCTEIEDMKDEQGDSIIYAAIKSGYTRIANILKNKKENIYGYEKAFLCEAARYGDIKAVKYLIKNKEDVDQRQHVTFGPTPLNLSTQNNHYEISRKLLNTNEVDIAISIKQDSDILHLAVTHGHTETVQAIMDAITENPALKTEYPKLDITKYLYLHTAAKNGHTEIVKILIENGANLDSVNSEEETALSLAVENNHVDTVEELLKAGATLDKNLLHKAAKKGYTKITQLLIEKIKVDQKDPEIINSVFIAAQNGHIETLQILLSNGANIDQLDQYDQTLLYYASATGNSKSTKTLIKAGADINLISRGLTPLSVAANNGHIAIVQFLILSGADINKENKQGNSPLITAILHERTDVAKVLIAAGADIYVANSHGNTALDIAKRHNLQNLVDILEAIKLPTQIEEVTEDNTLGQNEETSEQESSASESSNLDEHQDDFVAEPDDETSDSINENPSPHDTDEETASQAAEDTPPEQDDPLPSIEEPDTRNEAPVAAITPARMVPRPPAGPPPQNRRQTRQQHQPETNPPKKPIITAPHPPAGPRPQRKRNFIRRRLSAILGSLKRSNAVQPVQANRNAPSNQETATTSQNNPAPRITPRPPKESNKGPLKRIAGTIRRLSIRRKSSSSIHTAPQIETGAATASSHLGEAKPLPSIPKTPPRQTQAPDPRTPRTPLPDIASPNNQQLPALRMPHPPRGPRPNQRVRRPQVSPLIDTSQDRNSPPMSSRTFR